MKNAKKTTEIIKTRSSLFGSATSNINPLSTNPTKWSNTFKQQPTNFLSVFDHLWIWYLKGEASLLPDFPVHFSKTS